MYDVEETPHRIKPCGGFLLSLLYQQSHEKGEDHNESYVLHRNHLRFKDSKTTCRPPDYVYIISYAKRIVNRFLKYFFVRQMPHYFFAIAFFTPTCCFPSVWVALRVCLWYDLSEGGD